MGIWFLVGCDLWVAIPVCSLFAAKGRMGDRGERPVVQDEVMEERDSGENQKREERERK